MRLSSLKAHIDVVHRGLKKFKCELTQCNKSFSDRKSLIIHTRSHDKSRPYKCKYCDIAFSTIGNRSDHHRRHLHIK